MSPAEEQDWEPDKVGVSLKVCMEVTYVATLWSTSSETRGRDSRPINSGRDQHDLNGTATPRADNCGSTSKHQRTDNDIVFTEADLRGVQTPHNDAVIISMTMANYDVKRCLIDNGSFADVIFYDCFSQMGRLSAKLLKPVNVPLVGFIDDSIKVEGEIELSIIAKKSSRQSTVRLNFFIAWVPSTYNIILG